MARVMILGAGMMGSALCVPLADRNHDVRLVGTHLDGAIVESVRASSFHPTLGLPLPSSVRAFPHDELAEAASDAEVLLVGVSSAGVRWAAERLAPFVRNGVPVAMITKGLALQGERIETLPEVLRSYFDRKADVYPAAVAGPCIAGELARRVPTCVVLAGQDRPALERLVSLLSTDYYRLFPSADVVGVEVCAALKNAYAMGMAFGSGLHERRGEPPGPVAMHNYESAVFAQSIVEMQRLVQALGGDRESVAGLAGVGDLDVTCNGGRTGRFGRLLGFGVGLSAALERMQGVTLECLEILRVMRVAVPVLEASGHLASGATPLLAHLAAVALDDAPVAVPFERFF